MTKLGKIARVLTVLAGVVFVATFAVDSYFGGKAQLIQRVEKSDSSDLFGDSGTPIGSPAMLIIEDPKAFLPEEKDGAKQVDEKYLKDHKIYPLQLKTIQMFTGYSRIASAGFGVLLALVWWKGRRSA